MGWRAARDTQTHPCPQGAPSLTGAALSWPLRRSQSADGKRASRGYSQSDGGGAGPTFGGSQADGRCTASALGKLTVQGGRQSCRSEQTPTLAEETQPFSCGSPQPDGVLAPALEVPSIKEAS